MKIQTALIACVFAVTPAYAQTTVQPGKPIPVKPQTGVPYTNPDGSRPRAQTNPDGSEIRTIRVPAYVLYRPPNGYIAHPHRYNLPFPPYGHVWERYYNDAVLINLRADKIVQVRSRWFG